VFACVSAVAVVVSDDVCVADPVVVTDVAGAVLTDDVSVTVLVVVPEALIVRVAGVVLVSLPEP